MGTKETPSYTAKGLNPYMLTKLRENGKVQAWGHCLWCERGPCKGNSRKIYEEGSKVQSLSREP